MGIPLRGTLLRRGFSPGFVKRPHVAVMMADAYTAISCEFRRLRALAETGDGLTLSETKALGILATQMVALAKEERAQNEGDGVENLTDEELLQAWDETAKAMKK